MTEALVELYKERRDVLKRFLLKRLGDPDEAEDAVQEVFLKLHRDNRTDEIENPAAFLFRSAANIAIDRIRQRERSRARDGQWVAVNRHEVGTELVVDQPSMERVMDGKTKVARILQMLDDLSPQARRVFILHKLRGLTHKEVAEELGITRSTVEKHMIAALKRLVVVMEDEI